MIVILLAALLAALSVGFLIHPLMLGAATARRLGVILLVVLPVLALAIYLFQGHPDLPSRPALFETSGIRAELREPVRQEMILMKQLAAHPADTGIMRALGEARLRAGHTDEALAVLVTAYKAKPDDHDIRALLGAAHYAAALDALQAGGGRDAALPHFNEALRLAPRDAGYRPQLLRDQKKLKNAKP